MPKDERGGRSIAAVAALVAGVVVYIPLGYFFRYARVDFLPRPALLPIVIPVAAVGAFVHEMLVRGTLFAFLRRVVPPFAAPLVALAGAALPLAARLLVFPVPGVPAPVVVGHAFLVEYLISLGLSWMALGTGSPRPGAFSLAALWIARAAVGVRFRGGAVPLLELGTAAGAALLVAWVLLRTPVLNRRTVLGVD